MSKPFVVKTHYTVEDLLQIMAMLRSPTGCPWDREQTHESISSNLLEECHEALEAIENNDMGGLKEELGDVLLQVVFHAQMAEERGDFTFDEVADGICKKLITRHPHVFGDVKAGAITPEEVLKNWDAIKRQTKGTTSSDLLCNIPRSLPALMRAAKVQGRAKRVGFDWPELDGAWQSLESEVQELKEAIATADADHIEEEFGDLLFAAVNVSRFLKVNAEQALRKATDKFIRRFEEMEKLAATKGIEMAACSLSQLDELWEQIKTQKK